MFDLTIGETIWLVFFSGFIGTTGMTLAVWLLRLAGIKIDMVRSLGSLLMKNEKNHFRAGLILHYAWGILFAFLYSLILSVLAPDNAAYYPWYGVLISLFHGAVAALLMVVLIAEHHPNAEYRKGGFKIAVGYMIAHVAYGFLVGLAILSVLM